MIALRTVLLFFMASSLSAIGLVSAAERPDKFRQQVRNDPFVDAFIQGLSEKHGGCGRLENQQFDFGLLVYKQVEPGIYSDQRGWMPYEPSYLIILDCVHDVKAELLVSTDRDSNPFPIAQHFQRASLEHGTIYQTTIIQNLEVLDLHLSVNSDPLFVRLHDVISKIYENCSSIEQSVRGLRVGKNLRTDYGRQIWAEHEPYKRFRLSIVCPNNSSSHDFLFYGNYFPESGYVGWTSISYGRSME